MISDDHIVCDRCGARASTSVEGVDLCGLCYLRRLEQALQRLDDMETALREALTHAHAQPARPPSGICTFCGRDAKHHYDNLWYMGIGTTSGDDAEPIRVGDQVLYPGCYEAHASQVVKQANRLKRKQRRKQQNSQQ